MFKSKLFLKAFLPLLLIVIFFTASIYFYTVPLVMRTVYSMEESSSITILNNVYELANKIYLDMEAYRKSALETNKQELKDVTLLVESRIKHAYGRFKSGILTEENAKKLVLEEMQHYRYGVNDYVFIVDYDSKFLSHPDPALLGSDMSEVKDVKGNFPVSDMVRAALQNKEGGFTKYWWTRLGEKKPVEKLSLSKAFPPWKWVIGTGVYLEHITREVNEREKKAIEELRQTLRHIKIAKTGYVYVFDSEFNMIIHPNKAIENKNFSGLLNPVSKKPLAGELVAVADRNIGFKYKWDKLDDPGNYIYDKISWVRYCKDLGWHIGVSVYMEELLKSSRELGKRILTVAAAFLAISVLLGYFLMKKLVTPIKNLSETALKIKNGNMTAKINIDRNDEIGDLSLSFNSMVSQLRTNIETLDLRVKERTAKLEKAYEDIKRLDKMKSVFLSNVSHELRTPLTSILGFAQIVRSKLEDFIFPHVASENGRIQEKIKKIRANLDIIVSESEKLTAMINDIIDLVKFESGNIEWETERISISGIIDRAVSTIAPQYEHKGLLLIKEVEAGLPDITGDGDRLVQVLHNMLSNALKFTEKGTVTCGAKKTGHEITVSVRDTGAGMSKDELENIFEKFKQAGDVLTGKPKGLGVGLSICKEIVEHHGGRIWVESEPGRGSSFLFTVPLR